ncbi:unnamed protein product [Agarophyton chilense]|eukprot:gb/GEZJ01004560.1/.p1 GENE.gb/GEZJ01004560.1/~~gb/GEZJ01004560.1/.p1  ORF type:complete len:737 (-),score=114.30 gb/GEZJ01004560.1/:2247-4457(-)
MVARIANAERKRALRCFRQRGFVVQVGALEQLFTIFDTVENGESFSAFIEKTIEILNGPGGSIDGIFSKELAASIGERLKRDTERKRSDAKAALEVINTLTVPRWRPHSISTMQSRTAGRRVEAPERPLANASAKNKSEMFRTRYELILSKTLRNPKFRPPTGGTFSISETSPYFQLTGIESLSGSKGDQLVLGLLTQFEEGAWYLEDLNGTIKIDLSEAFVTSGMHTEGSFVIAQGKISEHEGEEPLFKVQAMGTPPHESRKDTIIALGRDSNLFGGQFDMSETLELLKIEEQSFDSVFLFISDVALDNSRVLAGLRHIWKGFLEDDIIPSVVLLMGNFLSHTFGQKPDDVSTLCEKFGVLGDMIKDEFEELIGKTTFVIVPGPNDPGPGNVLPRPPMPQMITKRFVDAVGSENVRLATNPCRIRFITQEIVILRDDLMQKMVRHCAVKPDLTEAGLMHAHLVKTVSDQSYLTPLPLSARPVLWAHDHGLWLYPTPHVLVLADKVDSYICTYERSLGMNPGSFKTDFSFIVYLPAEKRAQQSSLDSEDAQPRGQSNEKQGEENSVGADADEVKATSDEQHEETDREQGNQTTGDENSDLSVEGPGQGLEADVDALDSSSSPLGPPEEDIENILASGNSVAHDRSEEKGSERKPDDSKQPTETDEQLKQTSELPGELEIMESSEQGDISEDSDDDSHLEPAEGLRRLDIKTLVRNSLVEDSHPKPQVGDESNSDGE